MAKPHRFVISPSMCRPWPSRSYPRRGFELLITLLAAAEGEGHVAGGVDHAAEVRERVPAWLRQDVDRFAAVVALGLIGMVYDLPAPRSASDLLDALREADPVWLRQAIVTQVSRLPSSRQEEAIGAAAAGDADSLDEALACCYLDEDDGLRTLLALGPAASHDLVIRLVEGFASVVLDDLVALEGVLQRDAAATRGMSASVTPERLVEIATNGVTFEAGSDVRGVVLIPSLALRPWVIISDHRGRKLFFYPVADEHLQADPALPPAWLVETHKALGDERRLRIIHMLAGGPASLGDVAERLAAPKSTVHHHLRILRAAGLVRITLGVDKSYAIRPDAFDEAARGLRAYLAASPFDSTKGSR